MKLKINLAPKRLGYFFTGAVLFLFFLGLLALAVGGTFASFDPVITERIQAFLPRFLDFPLSIFSLLGGVEIMTAAVCVLAYLVYRRYRIFPISFITFGALLLFELIGKYLVYHPSPPKIFFRYDIPFSLPEYVQTGYSFPSGHVGRTFFVVVIFLILVNRFVKNRLQRNFLNVLGIAFVVVMMFSRVYLGEHWTSDVLGGAALGSAMGFFAMVYY